MKKPARKKTYKLIEGFRVKGDPAAIGKRLDKIRKTVGLTPNNVVEDAKHQDSPLHGEFTWDVNKAAQERWLEQARYIIRSIDVIFLGSEKSTRAFVPDVQVGQQGEEDTHCYEAVEVVLNDPIRRKQLLEEAKRTFLSWKKKYETLEELAEFFNVADKMLAAVV